MSSRSGTQNLGGSSLYTCALRPAPLLGIGEDRWVFVCLFFYNTLFIEMRLDTQVIVVPRGFPSSSCRPYVLNEYYCK